MLSLHIFIRTDFDANCKGVGRGRFPEPAEAAWVGAVNFLMGRGKITAV